MTTDHVSARARLLAAGAIPRTFVCGPLRDADWSKLSYHVSAEIDGEYRVGKGTTMDAAIDDLLAGTYRRPLLPVQVEMEDVA